MASEICVWCCDYCLWRKLDLVQLTCWVVWYVAFNFRWMYSLFHTKVIYRMTTRGTYAHSPPQQYQQLQMNVPSGYENNKSSHWTNFCSPTRRLGRSVSEHCHKPEKFVLPVYCTFWAWLCSIFVYIYLNERTSYPCHQRSRVYLSCAGEAIPSRWKVRFARSAAACPC